MNGIPDCQRSEFAQNVNQPIGTEKRCTKCGKLKTLDQFHKDNRLKGGIGSRCKDCGNKYTRNYIKNNPQKRQETTHNSYIKHIKHRKEIYNKWRKANAIKLKKTPFYVDCHRNVREKRGKPQFCEICNTRDIKKGYEWANLTGHYADINDYKRMCHSCHQKYDRNKRNNSVSMSEVTGPKVVQ